MASEGDLDLVVDDFTEEYNAAEDAIISGNRNYMLEVSDSSAIRTGTTDFLNEQQHVQASQRSWEVDW